MKCNNLLFWEKLNIPPPVPQMKKFNSDKARLIGPLFMEKIDCILPILEDQSVLHHEAALLSRLIYLFKRKLSSDKGFKFLQVINCRLKKYHRLDLLGILNSIRSHVEGSMGPSKGYYEWCLASVLKFSCLFHSVAELCVKAGEYFWNSFTSGRLWFYALIFLGNLARIRLLSEHLVRESSKWFSSLVPLLAYCGADKPWLPTDCCVPSSVSHLLNHPTYLTQKPIAPALTARRKEAVENEKTEMEVEENPESTSDLNIKSIAFHEDCGVAISRDELIAKNQEKPEPKKLMKSIGVSNFNFLKRESDLVDLLCRERVLRKSPGLNCLTRQLNEEQWTALDNNLSNLLWRINRSEENKQNPNKYLTVARKELTRVLLNDSKPINWSAIVGRARKPVRNRKK